MKPPCVGLFVWREPKRKPRPLPAVRVAGRRPGLGRVIDANRPARTRLASGADKRVARPRLRGAESRRDVTPKAHTTGRAPLCRRGTPRPSSVSSARWRLTPRWTVFYPWTAKARPEEITDPAIHALPRGRVCQTEPTDRGERAPIFSYSRPSPIARPAS